MTAPAGTTHQSASSSRSPVQTVVLAYEAGVVRPGERHDIA